MLKLYHHDTKKLLAVPMAALLPTQTHHYLPVLLR